MGMCASRRSLARASLYRTCVCVYVMLGTSWDVQFVAAVQGMCAVRQQAVWRNVAVGRIWPRSQYAVPTVGMLLAAVSPGHVDWVSGYRGALEVGKRSVSAQLMAVA